MRNSRILIAGDLVITNSDYTEENISARLKDKFSESDYNIVNLESPITKVSKNQRIIKTGPHLSGSIESTKRILDILSVDLVTLANNHILDYGEKGVEDTLDFCNQNNIQTVGAGLDLKLARQPKRVRLNGISISIVNFAENEWASAEVGKAGANPMDIIENVREIQKEKEISDKVFVIVHGGHEYYNLPSPRMQKQYRFYADNGADLVVGHHTHCVSGYEFYNDVPIYYSLGNFLFTEKSSFEDWYVGLVLEVKIEQGELKTGLIPVRQNKKDYSLDFLEESEDKNLRNRLVNFNKIIQEESSLKKQWFNYTELKKQQYMNYWSPTSYIKNKYIRGAIEKTFLSNILISKRGLSLFLNLMRCESHSDLSKDIISNKLRQSHNL